MPNAYEQRRANLRNLMREWVGADQLGHTNGSYVAQLIGPNPSREISEKVAREMEGKLGLPTGWLDVPHGEGRRVDDQLLGDVVRAVTAALRDTGHKATPDQMADLAALAYEHTKLKGGIDENFITRIVRLTKS